MPSYPGVAMGVSAEMMEPGRANCIPRDSLLQLMKDHSEVAVGVGEQLSAVYYTAHEEVRTLVFTTHSAGLPSTSYPGRPMPGKTMEATIRCPLDDFKRRTMF